LTNHSRAVALALDDRELPVRVQAALAITELVVVHDSGSLLKSRSSYPDFKLI
jgi:hypothetical protein